MTRAEERDMLDAIAEAAADVVRTYHAPGTPMRDSAGHAVTPHDLGEIARARVVLGLSRLRKLTSLAMVKIAEGDDGGGGRG